MIAAVQRPCVERIERRDGSWGPCGALSPWTRCSEHRRNQERKRLEKEPWRHLLRDPRWTKTALDVIERDGHQCTHLARGQRCTETTTLEVNHEEKLRNIWQRCGSPQRGAAGWSRFIREACDARKLHTLCAVHHKKVDNSDPSEAKARTQPRVERSRKRRSRGA